MLWLKTRASSRFHESDYPLPLFRVILHFHAPDIVLPFAETAFSSGKPIRMRSMSVGRYADRVKQWEWQFDLRRYLAGAPEGSMSPQTSQETTLRLPDKRLSLTWKPFDTRSNSPSSPVPDHTISPCWPQCGQTNFICVSSVVWDFSKRLAEPTPLLLA